MFRKSFPNKISRKIYLTKGARFTCQKRLETKIVLSNILISALSVVVISASIFSIAFSSNFDHHENIILSFLTIILSISILALSLTANSTNRAMMAAEIHRCGMELNRLYDSINAHMTNGIDGIDIRSQEKKWNDEYHEILGKCPFNHHTIDLSKFRAENVDELYEFSCGKRIRFWLCNSIWYYANIVLPLIAGLITTAAIGVVGHFLFFQ